MPPPSSQSPARLLGQILLNSRSLLLTSLLLPPKCGGQEVINPFIVNQSEFLQDGHFDWLAREFFYGQELINRLENADVIPLLDFAFVAGAAILPCDRRIVGTERPDSTGSQRASSRRCRVSPSNQMSTVGPSRLERALVVIRVCGERFRIIDRINSAVSAGISPDPTNSICSCFGFLAS